MTGRLGGPIYDRVYQVDVPAERVLVLSLTGSAGTDFDIYLFDSTATSVYATTGLVAKSTGPTSSETLTYPSVNGGRYYIDLSGFSDTEGDYRLTVQTATDSTPPQVSLVLDGGVPATSNPDVSVAVVATDDLSGVDSAQFSLDGTTWLPWHPYCPSLAWHFDGDDGLRTLWVRVSDRRGNISAPAHASIVLDRTVPIVLSRSPEPGAVIAASRPVFSVTFSEPIRPSSWLSFGLILQDASSTVIYGTYAWDATSNTGNVHRRLRPPGRSDLCRHPRARSLIVAGNPLAPLGSWTVRPLAAPRISLAATPRVAASGATVLLRGSVDSAAGGAFTLERLADDGTWDAVEPAPAGQVRRLLQQAGRPSQLVIPGGVLGQRRLGRHDESGGSDPRPAVRRRNRARSGRHSIGVRRSARLGRGGPRARRTSRPDHDDAVPLRLRQEGVPRGQLD